MTKASVKNIIDRLFSADEPKILQAITEAKKDLHADFVGPLLTACGSDSWPVRFASLEILSTYPAETLFPKLEEALRHQEDASLRSGAITTIEGMGAGAIPLLEKLLFDEEPDVRIFSAVLMSEPGCPEYVAPLSKALDDPEINVVQAAAESLGKIGDPMAAEPLIKSLKYEGYLLFPMIEALGKLKDPRAVEHLLPYLEDEMLGEMTVEALRKIGDPQVLPALLDLFDNEDEFLRKKAIAAYIEIYSGAEDLPQDIPLGAPLDQSLCDPDVIADLLELLEDEEPRMKNAALIGLARLQETSAVKPILKLAIAEQFAQQAIAAIHKIGPKALAELADVVEEADPKRRRVAARILANFQGKKAIKILKALSEDIAPEVRAEAALALVRHPPEQATDQLIKLLGDPDPEVRRAAGESLAFLPGGENRLYEMLDSENEVLVAEVISILGGKGDPEVKRRGLVMYPDAAPVVKKSIVRALGDLGGSENIDFFLYVLGNAEEEISIEAVVSFGKCGCTEGIEPLIDLLSDEKISSAKKFHAIESIGKLGISSAVSAIAPFLKDSDPGLAFSAIRALGSLRNPAALTDLAGVLGRVERDLRRAAVGAIGEIGGEPARLHLVDALTDSDWSVRNEAVRALEKIGTELEAQKIYALLNDHNPTVRRSAIAAIGSIGSGSGVRPLLSCLVDPAMSAQIAAALVKIGAAGLDQLRTALTDPLPRVRMVSSAVMGDIGDNSCVVALKASLSDSVSSVRAAAASSLGQLGAMSARAELNRLAREDAESTVREQARLALLKLSGE